MEGLFGTDAGRGNLREAIGGQIMIVIEFDKARAEGILDSLSNAKAIEPVEDGWTTQDMLTVAGTLFFALQSRGSLTLFGQDHANLPTEHREALWIGHTSDLRGAIDYLSVLARKVHDGAFDYEFEPVVEAAITSEKEYTCKFSVRPIAGFKEDEDYEE